MSDAKGRVLILDDDPVIGNAIARMVTHLEMDSMAVSDPVAFFQAINGWNPTHIILDLVMPVMDGVEVLQQLGLQQCMARIAISSGVGVRVLNAASVSAVEHGLDITCALPKPFKLAALEEFLFKVYPSQPVDPVKRPLNQQAESTITRSDIECAISENEFRLEFQPKVDCSTRLVTGFEALIRWHHPIKGLIMPDRFIPLSERLGLIGLVTGEVVSQALSWYASTKEAAGLSLSVNISAKTLEDHEFARWLGTTCRQYGIPTSFVTLEVTETAAMDDQLLTLDMFTRLRMKGFHVSIDDYGIGNSSLALLARLPFSEVKVDKRFAMTAAKSAESKAIIKSTVDLSHSLGLIVVAEGVEDPETLDYLEEIGCDQAQGYFIARPMPGKLVPEWSRSWQAKRSLAHQQAILGQKLSNLL